MGFQLLAGLFSVASFGKVNHPHSLTAFLTGIILHDRCAVCAGVVVVGFLVRVQPFIEVDKPFQERITVAVASRIILGR